MAIEGARRWGDCDEPQHLAVHEELANDGVVGDLLFARVIEEQALLRDGDPVVALNISRDAGDQKRRIDLATVPRVNMSL